MSVVEGPKATPPGTADAPVLNEKPAQETSEQASLLEKGKRKLFGLGKKKEEEEEEGDLNDAAKSGQVAALAPSPPLSPPTEHRLSPRSSPRMYPAGIASSPGRRINRSSSPALHSPASSQIFERNVQESVGELSPEIPIPSHIQVLEDHIPPVLEASSLAITDNHLNPDEVEIIMHSAHQPASAAVAGGGAESTYSLSQDNLSGRKLPVGHHDADDGASNYGSLDTTDVRRLSFISFADVVQSEHVEPAGRDPLEFMSLSSTANRSPSPVRSPASSHGFSASPPSGATSEKGADLGPSKGTRSPGSPTTAASGELQIETMRQALRGAGNDLPGTNSQPLSAVSLEDSATDQPPFK